MIWNAERTGTKIYDPDKDCFTAHYKSNIIICWVQYQKERDGYIVLNAYSHRLEIIEAEKALREQ